VINLSKVDVNKGKHLVTFTRGKVHHHVSYHVTVRVHRK
jgi:hypothetical protein